MEKYFFLKGYSMYNFKYLLDLHKYLRKYTTMNLN